MALLLGQVSADAANRLDNAPHLESVPWVGRWIPLTQSPESKAGGLGVEVKESKTGLLIVTIHSGSPAEQAGLLPGDQITAVDGEQLSGKSLKEAIDKVRGRPGSSTELNIRRGVVNLAIAFKRFRLGGGYHPIMSRVRYREALRHLWLRGIDGMQVFNSTTPGHAEIAISEVEDAQKIYDEMLAFRHFQERGSPINLAPYTPEITLLWSGLRLNDEVIIRAISLRERADVLNVEPWPGTYVSLSASTEGTTWHLQYDSDTKQVMKQEID
jgi:carboxyl-terminal processing protease